MINTGLYDVIEDIFKDFDLEDAELLETLVLRISEYYEGKAGENEEESSLYD